MNKGMQGTGNAQVAQATFGLEEHARNAPTAPVDLPDLVRAKPDMVAHAARCVQVAKAGQIGLPVMQDTGPRPIHRVHAARHAPPPHHKTNVHAEVGSGVEAHARLRSSLHHTRHLRGDESG